MQYYVGVDLGATRVRAAVGDGDAAVLARAGGGTPQGPDGAAVTDAVLEAVRAACGAAGVEPADIAAGAVAAIGPLDRGAGTVVEPANLPDGVESIALTAPLGSLLNAPVTLHNDATAGVVGERCHAEAPPDDMVYLSISTGIGAGACVDGHVLSGRDGNAGEVGHLTIDPDGAMSCGCGGRGHWEAYCSGRAIPEFARAIHDDGPTALPLSDPAFSAADVFAAAGDDLADRVLERVAAHNARGVAILAAAYAPSVVSVGGAVATNNPDAVVAPLRERLPDQGPPSVPEVRVTPLGDDAVLAGALASAASAGPGDRRRSGR